jgi:hypothetical protein
MDVPAQRYQDRLQSIKDKVKNTYESFRSNYDRFNKFRKFVFDTSLRDEEISLLATIGKPQLEFNVTEAYISRQLGEFSKHEPSIQVSAENEDQVDPLTIKVVDMHMRHLLSDSKSRHASYNIHKDLLSGGFSVFKITTDYANPMSMDQVINIDRVYDPTMCGFDPLARYSHKGDGRFCFELFPMSKEEFEETYPDVDIDELAFTRGFSGFNWSYLNDNTPTLIVADYYEKKKKKTKIVSVRSPNGQKPKVMTLEAYNKKKASWDGMEQFPGIIGKPRETMIETICRYRLIENMVIEYVETDFGMFPLVFADGNSVMLRMPKNGNMRQFTKPYIYHVEGAQRLKNFAGIALANEIENMVQHKFKVSKESLPKEEEFLQAYKDVQKASVLVYNEFFEQDPNARTTPPQEIARVPPPAEVLQTFVGTDSLMQNILGSYDASLGINDNQLSGVAIVEAATQSNAAAMPYIVGYLQALQRVAEIVVDLIPKYYKTARTIPILDEQGKRNFVKINQENGVDMFYDENALNVKVEAGANFQIQKSRALQQIIMLCQASPLFAEFVNTKGLPILLDNIEIRGIDQIKLVAEDWLQEVEKQKAQQQQMQQQQAMNMPAMLKAKNDAMKIQVDAQTSAQEAQVKMYDTQMRAQAEQAKADAEKARAEADIVLKNLEVNSRIKHEQIKMAHDHAKNIADHHVNMQKIKYQAKQRETE